MRTAGVVVAMIVAMVAVPVPAAVPPPAWTLRGDGLARFDRGRARLVRFGTPSRVATSMVAALLGRPVETHTAPDCGNGHVMVLTTFRGGLTLEFLRGTFVGWSLEASVGARFATDRGVTIGSSRKAVLAAYPRSQIDDTALGVMFTNVSGPSGFLDGRSPRARVTSLFAGETCLIF